LIGFVENARRILDLAWPALVGQLSVVAFATVDTFLVGRLGADDLAALAVGSAFYMTVLVTLVGVVQALGPIAGQLYGAGEHTQAGAQLQQAVWLSLLLAALGSLLLLNPLPVLLLADASPAVAGKVRAYLSTMTLAIVLTLLFTVYRTFCTAVSRTQPVMHLQLTGLAAKVPLAMLLVPGHAGLGLPALGAWGCALSSVLAQALQVLLAWRQLRRDPFYRSFALPRVGMHRPHLPSLRAMLLLGLPIGGSLLIGISGFTVMAILIARMGTTAVAAHQITVNVVSLLFMVPLALSQASSTLVAQHVGAGERSLARRVGWHALVLALLLAATLGSGVYLLRQPLIALYSRDAAVVAVTMSLLAWVVGFHLADAAQAIASFTLRAWEVTTPPMLIYIAALWGIGLGAGTLLGFDLLGGTPAALRGAPGYWASATVGVTVAAVALCGLLAWTTRRRRRSLL